VMGRTNEDIWEKLYTKKPDIVARRIAGELFLVPIRSRVADMSAIFSLNGVAGFIWENLGEKRLKDLCDEVIEIFEVGREQAETDILKFIDELLEAGLIKE
jgi:hypothetical protein